MDNMIRKMLCAGCVLAISSAMLCSCSSPALSTPIALAGAAASEPVDSGTANISSQNAEKDEEGANTAAPGLAGDVTAVNTMDITCHPCGAAVMEDGSLLVTDVYNRVIWHVSDGTSSVYAGSYSAVDSGSQPLGGYNDASYKDSIFRTPWAVAPFLDGWAVSDTDNHVIRLLQDGAVQTVNAHEMGRQSADESGTTFEHPTGLAADDEGNLYVADTFADSIYRITPEGVMTTETTGVSEPTGICWRDGALYIAESGKNRVVSLKNGELTVVAGSGETGDADGPADKATFSSPQGVSVGNDGTVYVADTNNSAIRAIRDGQVSTLYSRDIRDLEAFFPISPTGMLRVGADLYVCDPFARSLLLLPLAG